MSVLFFNYEAAPRIADVRALPAGEFASTVMDKIKNGWRVLALFGVPCANDRAWLFAALAKDGQLCATRSRELDSFPSMAAECPQTQLFEREIYENLHIIPHGHPWLKGVRVAPDAPGKSKDADYGFFRIQGGHTHEVGVGPIHAGIIEPGHFRFQCYGEQVLNLEIALGYQHRGIEARLMALPAAIESNQLRLRLVECIAGDASVAYATAQCTLLEKMSASGEISPQAQRIRRVGLELERLACHCGDLGAIAGDTGYLPTSSWNGRIRGDFLNLTASVCGNRFGREYIKPGGVNRNIEPELCEQMLAKLEQSARDALGSCEIMFHAFSVRDRMNGIGVLTREDALQLGLVGVPARACGIRQDARFDFPLSDLAAYGAEIRLARTGDVMARAEVRLMELRDSITLVRNDLQWLASNHASACGDWSFSAPLPPDRFALSLVESWRGEICHVAITGNDGNFIACKFFDPSFHNWPGLALAMRNGQISDFPLCNKSFNLSYCGHDL